MEPEWDNRYMRIAALAEQRDRREAELARVEADLRRLIYNDDPDE